LTSPGVVGGIVVVGVGGIVVDGGIVVEVVGDGLGLVGGTVTALENANALGDPDPIETNCPFEDEDLIRVWTSDGVRFGLA
jgi:hypothetical protein